MGRMRPLVLACLAALLACSPENNRIPNIVLISVDTLRADHVGVYGYDRETTPHLDALARGGVWFRDTVSTSSWTLPAHLSMLTGLLPMFHGVEHHEQRLDPAMPFLPEILQAAGYRTAGFVSGPFVDARYGFDRGFSVYRNFWDDEVRHLTRVGEAAASGKTVAQIRREAVRASHRDRTGPQVVKAAREWLTGDTGEPFFLFVHLWEPHYDFIPPPPFDTRFVAAAYDGALSMDDFIHNPSIHKEMRREDLDYVRSQYDGEIGFADQLIGELLGELRSLGHEGDTLLVITSDHGEEFFEHGRKGHRKTLYDESILVPLILSGAGVRVREQGIEVPVSLTDLAPTLLGLAGLPVPEEMTGRDLGELLAGESWPEHAVLNEPYMVSELRTQPDAADGCRLFATRTSRRKVILGCDEPPELFDLKDDPGERHNLYGPSFRTVVEDMQALRRSLEERAALLPRQGAAPVTLDEELRERLRSLGYVE